MAQGLTTKLIPNSGEGTILIWPWNYNGITQGTWPIYITASQLYNTYLYNSTQTDSDQIDYKVYLTQGLYGLKLLYMSLSTGGICDILIDNVSVRTIDMYSSVSTYNRLGGIPIFEITSPGLKTLSLKVDGKNALSTSYYLPVTQILVERVS